MFASDPIQFTSDDLRQNGLEGFSETAYIEAEFTAEKDATVYCFDTSVPDSINGKRDASTRNLGYHKAGEVVKDVIQGDEILATANNAAAYCANLAYAYADNDVLADYASLLNARGCTFNLVKNTDFIGEFTAETRECILFTLHWDEGWTAYIDGKEVPIHKTWDLFMSIDAPEGHHTYEMKFFPAWMNYGLMLSGTALVSLIVFMVVWKKQQITAEKSEKQVLQITE